MALRRSRVRISSDPPNIMDKVVLVELIKEHKSQREMALLLKCTQSTIKYWLRQYKLKTLFQIKSFQCKQCGEVDSTKAMKKGLNRIAKSLCKSCHNVNTIARFRQNKIDAVNYKGGSCIDCGYDKCPGALVFHHRDPNIKDPDWATMKNRTLNQIKTELDKCDLLCATCHMERHWHLGV